MGTVFGEVVGDRDGNAVRSTVITGSDTEDTATAETVVRIGEEDVFRSARKPPDAIALFKLVVREE